MVPESRQKLIPGTDRNVTVREYSKRWLQLVRRPEDSDLGELPREDSISTFFQPWGPYPSSAQPIGNQDPARGETRGGPRHRFNPPHPLRHSRAAELGCGRGDHSRQPCRGTRAVLKLSRSRAERRDRIRAFDRAQLTRFLDAAQTKTPVHFRCSSYSHGTACASEKPSPFDGTTWIWSRRSSVSSAPSG